MADTQKPIIDQPKNQVSKKASKIDARIFVMPAQYRHGAQGNMHQPTDLAPAKSKAVVETPDVPQAPKAPPKPLVQKKKKGSKKLLIIGAVVIVLLLIGGWFAIQSVTDAPEEVVIQEPISRPAPDVIPDDKPEPEPDVTDEPIDEPDPFPVTITPGVDSDSDGLTDTEEKIIYGTDPRLPDTDSDGFLDGNEVFHGYNPGGTAPGTLLGSELVQMFTGVTGRATYTIFHPSTWDAQVDETEIVFDAQTGEGFRLTTSFKDERQTLIEWADENVAEEISVGVTKQGLASAQSESQLTVYIDMGSAVMVLVYDTGIKTRVDYLQTFQMMLNSVTVEIEEAQVPVTEPAPEQTEDTTVPQEEVQ
jgi:hypothetical protein